jgi:phenylalanyl-tRNA synthetase alpha chain
MAGFCFTSKSFSINLHLSNPIQLALMEQQLHQLKTETLEKISNIQSQTDLTNLEVEILGRKGTLTEMLKGVKDLPADQKPTIGKLANVIKTELETAFSELGKKLKLAEINNELNKHKMDVTEPSIGSKLGHIHPLYQVQKEVEAIFASMGFEIADGPEVEAEYYNFETLNIPKDHPARDMQDTFFIDKNPDQELGNLVLRTHTSPVQTRSMLKKGAPLRLIVPGRVFRYEATDATHDATFDQVEGLLIDKGVGLSHLKGVLTEFLSKLFGREVKIRFRPGYFPFVEPGLEVDFSCAFCQEQGCRICKYTGFIEFMGAGMVHENVLRAGGIDPAVYQGWAFGFGLTRLVMMRYGITDIRHLYNTDIRFANQF